MKKLMMMAMVLAASVGAVSAQEAAKEEAAKNVKEVESSMFSFEATADFYSAYIWRGLIVNKHAVMQPGAAATLDLGDAGAFKLDVWSDFNLAQNSKHAANTHSSFAGLDQINYTGSYAIDISDFTLGAGHIWYTFPKSNGSDYGHSTEEVFLSLAYNNDIVTPFASLYYDYNMVEGCYAKLGLNKQFELADRLTAGCEIALGMGDDDYNGAYFGADTSDGLLDLNVALSLAYSVTENVSVGATLAWMSLVDDDARDNVSQSDIIWGGLNLKAGF